MIFEASSELLANLHFNNIFWGDASLSNILVKFLKIKDENGRTFTELKAFLADAETVSFLKNISNEQRQNDLDNFIRSIEEVNRNLVDKKTLNTMEDDNKYFLNSYSEHFSLLQKTKQFEETTGRRVKNHFYRITDKYSIDSIIKQIEEHKWYLSEKASKEVDLKTAAKDWIKTFMNQLSMSLTTLNFSTYSPKQIHLNFMWILWRINIISVWSRIKMLEFPTQ